MGRYASSDIIYGVHFDESTEFPWSEVDDLEVWWLEKILQFKPSKELFDESGEYIDGIEPSKKEVEKYFEERREALKQNPIPIKEERCGYEHGEVIITIPDEFRGESGARGDWEEPTKLNPENICKGDTEKWDKIILDFCDKFGIELDEEQKPAWLLTSSYG